MSLSIIQQPGPIYRLSSELLDQAFACFLHFPCSDLRPAHLDSTSHALPNCISPHASILWEVSKGWRERIQRIPAFWETFFINRQVLLSPDNLQLQLERVLQFAGEGSSFKMIMDLNLISENDKFTEEFNGHAERWDSVKESAPWRELAPRITRVQYPAEIFTLAQGVFQTFLHWDRATDRRIRRHFLQDTRMNWLKIGSSDEDWLDVSFVLSSAEVKLASCARLGWEYEHVRLDAHHLTHLEIEWAGCVCALPIIDAPKLQHLRLKDISVTPLYYFLDAHDLEYIHLESTKRMTRVHYPRLPIPEHMAENWGDEIDSTDPLLFCELLLGDYDFEEKVIYEFEVNFPKLKKITSVNNSISKRDLLAFLAVSLREKKHSPLVFVFEDCKLYSDDGDEEWPLPGETEEQDLHSILNQRLL